MSTLRAVALRFEIRVQQAPFSDERSTCVWVVFPKMINKFPALRLPDSNDLTLLATIRRLLPHIPVILMTAYGSPEVTKAALDLGVYRVMSKPFDMPDLEELILQAYASGPM